MAELKTVPTGASVTDFLNAITDEKRRQDCLTVCALMQEITGEAPIMWGASIVGFGTYRYCSPSGRSGNWMLTGFASRKASLTLYIMSGFGEYDALLEKLGKYSTGVSCLYIKRLSDVDLTVLRALITQSVAHMRTIVC